MTVIELIFQEMSTDEQDDSKTLVRMYKNATKSERKIMDKMSMKICGWTLATLINKSHHPEHFEKDGLGFLTTEHRI